MTLIKFATFSLMTITILVLLGCGTGPSSIAGSTCEGISEDKTLIKLLEEKTNPFTGEATKAREIMRFNQIELVSHDDDGIWCEGTVKFDDAEKIDIEFHWYKDEDGDGFIGYSEK